LTQLRNLPFAAIQKVVNVGSLPTFAALSNEISFKPEASGGTADFAAIGEPSTNGRFIQAESPV
jgi:hypothetical protein